MKKTEMQCVLKSYARGVLTAITPLLAIQSTDPKAYFFAIVAGVIAPAIRAIDKNDAAFGFVADAVVTEAKKISVAKKTAKKSVK
jgi:hypothetical protein